MGVQQDDNILCICCPAFWPFNSVLRVYKVIEGTGQIWGQGLKAIVYLDDGIVAVRHWEKALEESARVKSDLVKAGSMLLGTINNLNTYYIM